jgi:hypothetical protein
MTNAFKYLTDNKIPSSAEYGKYLSGADTCHADPRKGLAKVTSFYQIAKDETHILKELADHGPIAVGINGRYL